MRVFFAVRGKGPGRPAGGASPGAGAATAAGGGVRAAARAAAVWTIGFALGGRGRALGGRGRGVGAEGRESEESVAVGSPRLLSRATTSSASSSCFSRGAPPGGPSIGRVGYGCVPSNAAASGSTSPVGSGTAGRMGSVAARSKAGREAPPGPPSSAIRTRGLSGAVVARGAAVRASSDSAFSTARAPNGRSLGSRARSWARSVATAGGTPGGAAGASAAARAASAWLASSGSAMASPVSISRSSRPSAYRSARSVTSFPAACSGAIDVRLPVAGFPRCRRRWAPTGRSRAARPSRRAER